MASTLVPLNFKPGIQRDGTLFQSDFCTDGQWIRFQRGRPKKMGGLHSGGNFSILSTSLCTDMLITPNLQNQNRVFIYFSTTTGIVKTEFQLEPWRYVSTIGNITPNLPTPTNKNLKWQSEVVVNPTDQQRYVVFLGTNNAQNISQNTASLFYYGLDQDTNPTPLTSQVIDPQINGGMCFSNPYLFLYGTNGKVLYSANNDPFNFNLTGNSPAKGGELKISNDKVVWGSPIRGGANSPSILFWTSASVVRITNVGTDKVEFRIDVVAKGTSILSSRCVIESDGVFFWPGTNRFYIYNGIVDKLENNMNRNYFFENIDREKTQLSFGVKNPANEELWWFYPLKDDPANNRDKVSNYGAIIFNKGKSENTWYDVKLRRTCGTYYEAGGFMCTFGAPMLSPNQLSWLPWRHEYGIAEIYGPDADSGRITQRIESSFTTPTISWAAFNPKSPPDSGSTSLVDRWVDLKRFEPDFNLILPNDLIDYISLEVITRTYARSTPTTLFSTFFTAKTEKIDIRAQGRHMTLKISSNGFFEMGNVLLTLGIGDGQ